LILRQLKIRLQVPHELDRKKALGRRMPAKPGEKQSGRETTSVDGEDGVTGGSHAALAANQPVG
jgi:hypothetical protein